MISQVTEVTGVTMEQAQMALERSNWNQDGAIDAILNGNVPQANSFSQNIQRNVSQDRMSNSQQNIPGIPRTMSGSSQRPTQIGQNVPGSGQNIPGIPRSMSQMTNPSGAVDSQGHTQGGYNQGGYNQGGQQSGTGSQHHRPQPSHQSVASAAKLRLSIIAAFNLANTSLGLDSNEGSDPFVVARLGAQSFTTKTLQNNLNPVWNEHFDFDVLDPEDQLHIQVLNSNNYQAHDVLGELRIPIRPCVEKPNNERKNGREALSGDQRAKIEIELVYLTADQMAEKMRQESYNQGYPQGPNQYQVVQSYNVDQHDRPRNWLPLPKFDQLGAEAFLAPSNVPARQAQYANSQSGKTQNPDDHYRRPNYESRACHLGQYDYSKEATYFPKQEHIDKKQWGNDPFYGWRNGADSGNQRGRDQHGRDQHSHDHHSRDRNQTGTGSHDQHGHSRDRNQTGTHGLERQHSTGTDGQYPRRERSQDFEPTRMEMEQWQRDPFHGWLTSSQHASGQQPAHIEAQGARQLMSLPSFSEQDKTRFNDNRDYVGEVLHDARPRHANPATPQEAGVRGWKDDAFFGWLPGRGPGSADKHTMYRPNNAARLERLPSFSEGGHLRGRGLGVLKVWVASASGLTYPDSSGKRGKPNPCVRLRFARTEVVTPTITNSTNPVWNTNEYVFEVPSFQEEPNPELVVDVLDMPTTAAGQAQNDFVLGRMRLPVKAIVDDYEQTVQNRLQANKKKREKAHLLDPQRNHQSNATIEIDFLFEPYDHLPKHQPQQTHHTRGVKKGKGMGSLEVIVRKAFNLVNLDTGLFGDVSDPYVLLKLKSQSDKEAHRTVTKDNDLNPVWDAGPYRFDIFDHSDVLELKVMDEDLLTSDDFLGSMAIPLERVIANFGRPLTIKDELRDTPAPHHGPDPKSGCLLEVKLTYTPNHS